MRPGQKTGGAKEAGLNRNGMSLRPELSPCRGNGLLTTGRQPDILFSLLTYTNLVICQPY